MKSELVEDLTILGFRIRDFMLNMPVAMESKKYWKLDTELKIYNKRINIEYTFGSLKIFKILSKRWWDQKILLILNMI